VVFVHCSKVFQTEQNVSEIVCVLIFRWGRWESPILIH